jgi:NADH-quinone oxidoreductase subunit G
MIEIEIDGVKVEVAEGSMVMDAAQQMGTYVPHFCYHKKLSIAANCRMCLVEVEKAPKPLPACATPVTAGMVVRTASPKAIAAQKSVMEFLLINHPLDCPICDQGGECQLQDLAVGYGGSSSRYQEEKRVVFHKEMGPLISAQEMSRCIHCTRCVRFGQEVAGVMELGMAGRGEHSEILSFVGRSVESELSGNMIDLCPVGALTSKPFRYSARTWELARRRSVSPHDSLGANIVVQVKGDRVMRVLPYEVDDLNECWISDKDRFAYEGLNSKDRVTKPLVKRGDQWVQTDWESALNLVVEGLQTAIREHGPAAVGLLAGQTSTVEELALAAKLMRGLGSENIDVRLRRLDFSADTKRKGIPWLGTRIDQLKTFDRVLVIGSFLRKDHPLIAQRLRQAARRKTKVFSIHSCKDEWLMPVTAAQVLAPQQWAGALAELIVAVSDAKSLVVPTALQDVRPSKASQNLANALVAGTAPLILMGNMVAQAENAAELELLVQTLAGVLSASFGHLTESGNTLGAYVANALPNAGGLNAAQMLGGDLKALLLMNTEPNLDAADGARALQTLRDTALVVALATHRSQVSKYAHIILPIAPFTETSGSLVNCEGRLQAFNATVKPLGQVRPAWKVLRVLGNLLGLKGFDFNSTEEIRQSLELKTSEIIEPHLNNQLTLKLKASGTMASIPVLSESQESLATVQRVADVPIYRTDPIVRSADSLQFTSGAGQAVIRLNQRTLRALGLDLESSVQVSVQMSDYAPLVLPVELDESQAFGVAQISAALEQTQCLGPMFGGLKIAGVSASS